MNRNQAGTAPSDAGVLAPTPRGSLLNSLGASLETDSQSKHPVDLITREQFDAEALAYANKLNAEMGIRTAHTLLTDARIGYDRLPPHLKADLHKRLGVEPVQMFRRVASPSTSRGD